MRDAHVAGMGMTRFRKFPDCSVRSLPQEAVAGALTDAGLSPGQVEVAFSSAAFSSKRRSFSRAEPGEAEDSGRQAFPV